MCEKVSITDPDPRGDIMKTHIASPALRTAGGAAPEQSVVIYRPPAYFHTNRSFPIVFILQIIYGVQAYGGKTPEVAHPITLVRIAYGL